LYKSWLEWEETRKWRGEGKRPPLKLSPWMAEEALSLLELPCVSLLRLLSPSSLSSSLFTPPYSLVSTHLAQEFKDRAKVFPPWGTCIAKSCPRAVVLDPKNGSRR
jgi:hypothetical protein